MKKLVNKVVIVGGGTAGWMSAAYLSHMFAHKPIQFTLIESSEIGTVGVGEATIPTIREFYQSIGIADADIMSATHATYKLGIEFRDWHTIGKSFFHPFANYGQNVQGIDFHHYWNKLRLSGYNATLDEFSLGVMLAKHNKFNFPSANPPSAMSVFDWALHFDASLFAKFLRRFSEKKGVVRIDEKITHVNLRTDDGFIASLDLANGQNIEADFFIDCSGFQGLLIEGALKTGYENWSEWLLCDRAVAVQREAVDQPKPYTLSTATKAGWMWNIPLRHRNGHGHVYSSVHLSDDEAINTLLNHTQGNPLTDPKVIHFLPGRRKKAWNKNCVAVGLSSGFLEPLESTSIALIELAIQKIRLFFPDTSFNETMIAEFNERTRLEYERVRDFIIFHYKANARNDSDFWRYCQNMNIPEELAHKISLFKERGYLLKYPYEIFQMPSWLSLYTGNQYLSDAYDTYTDKFETEELKTTFDKMRHSVMVAVNQSPDYVDFLRKN